MRKLNVNELQEVSGSDNDDSTMVKRIPMELKEYTQTVFQKLTELAHGSKIEVRTMKKLMLATLFIPSISIASQGGSTQSESMINKTYDHKKFCYYADKEFSKGARLFQVDEWKTCTLGKNGFLVWASR
ncbi:hypothetical protein CW748_09110 [Alteromonadales bacterium alter-6D02]|nr:hypothetical protein CW748_09110 [Alteromonadales bacterium alter-6D02]